MGSSSVANINQIIASKRLFMQKVRLMEKAWVQSQREGVE
jgi:hypothetical protein